MPFDTIQMPQQIQVDPVGAFLKGRAMALAYQNDKLQNQMLQQQVADYPKQQEFERQKQAIEAATNLFKEKAAYAKLMEVKPPTTRTILQGNDEVNQEFNPETNSWKEVGRGPKRAGVEVNVGEKAPSAFATEAGKKSAEDLSALQQTAQGAADSLATITQGKELMGKGIISGFAGDWRLNLARVMNIAGANNAEVIANTEAYYANAASLVGKIIKQFGSGTGLSDADREYAEKAAAGKITMNEKSMKRILDFQETISRNLVKRYNDQITDYQNRGVAGVEFYSKVKLPEETGTDSTPPIGNLKRGVVTTFKNGQQWTLDSSGKPLKVR